MAAPKTTDGPNLPLCLARLDKFLDKARGGIVEKEDVKMARDALKSICVMFYDVEDPFNCLGTHLWFPPILMNKAELLIKK
jgi:hypothetical protein